MHDQVKNMRHKIDQLEKNDYKAFGSSIPLAIIGKVLEISSSLRSAQGS